MESTRGAQTRQLMRFGRTLLVIVALLLTVAGTALGVVGGQPDGNQHPNVGQIFGLDSRGFGIFRCTGTLINPTTVLTAAHCVGGEDFGQPIAQLIVDFDSHLDQLPNGNYFIARFVTGTGDWDPAFRDVPAQGAGGANAFFADSEHDVGLLHLSAPAASVFPGIQPAAITTPNALEPYRTGPKKDLFLQVGYGDQREGPPGQVSSFFADFTRNQSLMPPKKATDGLFTLGGNPNNAVGYGGPCAGDSGSPIFQNGLIVAVFSFSQGGCQNLGGGPRVDAGPGRAFLRSHGLVP